MLVFETPGRTLSVIPLFNEKLYEIIDTDTDNTLVA